MNDYRNVCPNLKANITSNFSISTRKDNGCFKQAPFTIVNKQAKTVFEDFRDASSTKHPVAGSEAVQLCAEHRSSLPSPLYGVQRAYSTDDDDKSRTAETLLTSNKQSL
jgi:hypothetical protein